MKKSLINWWASGGYTSEYQAILTKATSLGYTLPSPANQIKQNAFMQALKTAGILSHLDCLRVYKYSNNISFAGIDWIDPTRTVSTNVNTPSLDDAKGIFGNGTTSYVNLNATPSLLTKFTQNDASYFVYAGDTVPSIATTFMTATFDGTRQCQMGYTGNTFYTINNTTGVNSTGNIFAVGLIISQRIISTSFNLIDNGVTTNLVDTSLGRPTTPFFLCARNNNSTPDSFNTNKIAVWGAGDGLSGLTAALKTATDNFYAS